MKKKEEWILVFDSGLGGISVLRELVHVLPEERFLYFGDSKNAPYGDRSTEEVREFTANCIAAFIPRGIKAVVVACNTATAAAIECLRARYPGKIIIGMEPALKLAAERHPGGRILVMATHVTLREQKFCALMDRFSSTCRAKSPIPHLGNWRGRHCLGLYPFPLPETSDSRTGRTPCRNLGRRLRYRLANPPPSGSRKPAALRHTGHRRTS